MLVIFSHLIPGSRSSWFQVSWRILLRVSRAAWRSAFCSVSNCSWNTGLLRSSLMGPSGLITAKARQGFIQMGIRWWVSGGPGHRSLQACRGSGFVQPALIVWNHCGGANDPDSRLRLFHQNMAAGILLAKRDLAIAANELDGGRMERGCHGERR